MQTNLIISLEEFPEEGRYLSGELDAAVFGIDSAALRSTGPLSYELEVQLFETELMVRGSISAPFELRCDRCLAQFPYTVELDELTFSYDVKGKLALDITEDLREEVVLALPSYPKCEISGLECEINDTFGDFRLDKDPQSGVDSATPSAKACGMLWISFRRHKRRSSTQCITEPLKPDIELWQLRNAERPR